MSHLIVILFGLFLSSGLAAEVSLGKRTANTKWSISTGLIYTDLDRGRSDAPSIRSIPLIVKYKWHHWDFSYSVARIKIRSHQWVVTEVNESVEFPEFLEVWEEYLPVEREGVGDSTLGLRYTPKIKRLAKHRLSIGGKIKLPTGDKSQGLSSGKADYTLYFGDMYRIKRFVLDARIGWQMTGIDKPEVVDDVDDVDDVDVEELDDFVWDDWWDDSFDTEEWAGGDWGAGDWYLDEPVRSLTKRKHRYFLSLGGLYLVDRKNTVGFSFYQKAAAYEDTDLIRKYGLFYSRRINREWSFALFGAKALNKATADLSLAFQITKKL